MAKDRVQVQDLYKDRGYLPQIQPTARPVDTFVQPGHPVQRNSDRQIGELIDAFKDVQPGLSRFAAQRVDQVNQEQLVEGHKAALANKAQFKEAINQGAIPAGVSPWFQVGWERQKAEVASTDFDRELREAYASSGLSEQNDPTKYNQWVAEFTHNWQESHQENKDNPEFQPVFNAMASKSQDNLASVHAAERTRKIEAEVEMNTDLQIGSILDYPNGDQAGTIDTIVKTQIANGLNGQVANKIIASAVVRKAIENNDLYQLEILKDIPSGSGTVGDIGWVKEMVMQARDGITRAKSQEEHFSHLETKAQKQEQIKEALRSGFAKIAENPFKADVKAERDNLLALDPDQADKLYSFTSAAIASMSNQNKVLEDEGVKASLLISSIEGNLTEGAAIAAQQRGEIDYDTLKDLLVNQIPKAKEYKSITRDPMVSQIRQNIRMTITRNEDQGMDAEALAKKANIAEAYFYKAMINFKATPRTEMEVLEYGNKLSTEVIKLSKLNDPEKPNEPLDLEDKDPTRDRIFEDEKQFKEALEEAGDSDGTSGILRTLADQYQMTIENFIAAQRAVFKARPKPPPK